MSIQEQIGQLESLRQNAPGIGIETVKQQIDDWVNQVVEIAGGGLGGIEQLRGIAEAAKQDLDQAAAAMAQMPLEIAGIVRRLQGG